MKIGFMGLGAMGAPMADNLLRAGHALRVWNRSPAAAAPLTAAGATRVDTPAEAACGDVLITMLADDDTTREVVVAGGR